MSKKDLLGLILNRIKLLSQGKHYVSDLSINDRVLPRKVAEALSELQIFSSYCGKRRGGPGIFLLTLYNLLIQSCSGSYKCIFKCLMVT